MAEMLCKLPEGTTLRSFLFIFLLLNKDVNQSINQSHCTLWGITENFFTVQNIIFAAPNMPACQPLDVITRADKLAS